jgi:hypothetical protein
MKSILLRPGFSMPIHALGIEKLGGFKTSSDNIRCFGLGNRVAGGPSCCDLLQTWPGYRPDPKTVCWTGAMFSE